MERDQTQPYDTACYYGSVAMNGVEKETAALIKEIRRSSEYHRYHRLKKKLGEDPQLRDKVDSYRRQCFFLQNKEYEESDLERIDQLQKDNQQLLDMALVREFLISEQELCRMASTIMNQITKAVDIGLEL